MTPNNLLPKSRIALKREDFQAEVNGKETDLFILKNKNEMEISLENDDNSVALLANIPVNRIKNQAKR